MPTPNYIMRKYKDENEEEMTLYWEVTGDKNYEARRETYHEFCKNRDKKMNWILIALDILVIVIAAAYGYWRFSTLKTGAELSKGAVIAALLLVAYLITRIGKIIYYKLGY